MEIQSLKINQEISDIKEQLNGLLDLFYPVGSYYETSDISFYPEAVWGGTWRMDTKGYVTVGGLVDGGDSPAEGGLDINLGETMGEVEHTLTVDEMPSHVHTIVSWNYYNQVPANGQKIAKTFDGADYNSASEAPMYPTGGSQPHNNIQPSIGVCRWHRIA